MKFRVIVYKRDAENDQDALNNLFQLTDAKPSNTNDCFTCVSETEKMEYTFHNITASLIISCSFTALHYFLYSEER